MNKQISPEQINAVLQTVFETNIPAKSFEALKEFFNKLPNVEVEEVKE